MQFIYLHVKHALHNIQRVQRIFGQGLITTDVPTETFWNEKKVKQESFNAYFAEVNHNGEDDLEVRLIDQTDNVEELKKKESFWQHELHTFQPNGLNGREGVLFDV